MFHIYNYVRRRYSGKRLASRSSTRSFGTSSQPPVSPMIARLLSPAAPPGSKHTVRD